VCRVEMSYIEASNAVFGLKLELFGARFEVIKGKACIEGKERRNKVHRILLYCGERVRVEV